MPRGGGTKSAQEIVQAWQQAMASPQTQQRWVQGIQRTTVNPAQAAAQRLDAYAAACQAAVSSGRMAQALQQVTLQQWQQACVAMAARLASGAQKGLTRYQRAMQSWAPIYAQVSQEVRAMPKGGLSNGIARATHVIQAFYEAGRRGAATGMV